jgi:hypothetical protein
MRCVVMPNERQPCEMRYGNVIPSPPLQRYVANFLWRLRGESISLAPPKVSPVRILPEDSVPWCPFNARESQPPSPFEEAHP